AAPRKLVVGKPGLLNSLHWVRTEAGTGRPPARGDGPGGRPGRRPQLQGRPDLHGHRRRPGLRVLGRRPGDRVMVMGIGTFSTSFECLEMACAKIPDHLAFSEAATMSTVCGTAIYSLINKAGLEKGQSVLIHSACGGTLFAQIFCTAGSEDKVRHLVNECGIPRDRIFHSRSVGFLQDVKKATGGRGVDVVLNSLSGELLHASWEWASPRTSWSADWAGWDKRLLHLPVPFGFA
ncbi:hypothetical protein CH063_15594, partial [Colletotrichum higginsianum]